MQQPICVTCGTQYPLSAEPPLSCPICADERQYVGAGGQQWTTLSALQSTHHNDFAEREAGLTSIHTQPDFAINQRAYLVQTPAGAVLWDCIALLDEATVAGIAQRGDLKGIAISHPHYYTTMRRWAERFGVPVYLHADEREWVMDPGPELSFWSGDELSLLDGITLVRLGGHYPGASVLLWRGGAGGKGVMLSGDTIQVVPDSRWVSFMYSYPNFVPLPGAEVQRIAAAACRYPFDRIYGAFGKTVQQDGRGAVQRSAERYLRALQVPLHQVPLHQR